MSRQAFRYTNPARLFKVEPSPYSMSSHHVPPRHPATHTPFLLRKSVIDHRAYHQLFRNAGSLQQCIDILIKEWWTNPAERKDHECEMD